MRPIRTIVRLHPLAFFLLALALTGAAGWLWFGTMFAMGTFDDGVPGPPGAATGIAVDASAILILAAAAMLLVATFAARARPWALALALVGLAALPAFAAFS